MGRKHNLHRFPPQWGLLPRQLRFLLLLPPQYTHVFTPAYVSSLLPNHSYLINYQPYKMIISYLFLLGFSYSFSFSLSTAEPEVHDVGLYLKYMRGIPRRVGARPPWFYLGSKANVRGRRKAMWYFDGAITQDCVIRRGNRTGMIIH